MSLLADLVRKPRHSRSRQDKQKHELARIRSLAAMIVEGDPENEQQRRNGTGENWVDPNNT